MKIKIFRKIFQTLRLAINQLPTKEELTKIKTTPRMRNSQPHTKILRSSQGLTHKHTRRRGKKHSDERTYHHARK